MSTQRVDEHRPPALGQVFRAQLALARPGRGGLLALVLVLAQVVAIVGFGGILGVSVAAHDRGVETILWSRLGDIRMELPAVVFALLFVMGSLGVWGLIAPLVVWRAESPSARGYHWSMPVNRRTHDLLRVAAGAVWLLAAGVFWLLALLLCAALSGRVAELAGFGPAAWLDLLVGPLLVYLLASVTAVRCERPAAWFWGTLGVLSFGWALLQAAQLEGWRLGAVAAIPEAIAAGRFGLGTALAGAVARDAAAAVGRELAFGAGPGRWALTAALWLALAAAAVYAAASARPRP